MGIVYPKYRQGRKRPNNTWINQKAEYLTSQIGQDNTIRFLSDVPLTCGNTLNICKILKAWQPWPSTSTTYVAVLINVSFVTFKTHRQCHRAGVRMITLSIKFTPALPLAAAIRARPDQVTQEPPSMQGCYMFRNTRTCVDLSFLKMDKEH